jgi:uncharacterized protein (TIGR02246 family)
MSDADCREEPDVIGGVMGTGTDLWNQCVARMNNEDWTGFVSLFTSDAVYAGPNLRYEGREAIEAHFDEVGKAIADVHYETSLVVEDGDSVIAEWTWRSTQTGQVPTALLVHASDDTEIALTHGAINIAGVSVCKIREGKLASMRDYYDTAEMMRQLG